MKKRYLSFLLLLFFTSSIHGDEITSESYLPIIISQNAAAPAYTTYLPIISKQIEGMVEGPIWGVNFINSAEDLADEQQFQNGLSTGAAWNRFPLYWHSIETSPAVFEWTNQDKAVINDIAHGLKSDLILLGTPSFYLTHAVMDEGGETAVTAPLQLAGPQAAAPVGLYAPIFTDGSDIPGTGKQINPDNTWARFVETAVNRYKPNGVLAQREGWAAGVGITHWEMWNEPDLDMFWNSSTAEYARLLKTGYIAAKHADPQAQIIFAGLANNVAKLSYYNDVMALYDADPQAASHAYFHDIFATHSYFYAHNSWYHVYRANNTLKNRGLDKPIWLNETGVRAWNDYPGPLWDSHSGYSATMDEQADYTIQTALYAMYAGADAIFHFQLYDGCGNQPQGTDFPVHHGELCNAEGNLINNPAFPCGGDANGLFSNPTDAACFRQHPSPESPRKNFAAFTLLTTYLQNVEPLWRSRPGGDDPYNGPQELIAFYRPETNQRIIGMWARFGEAQTAVIATTNADGKGMLVSADGTTQEITAVNGVFTIQLPAATNQNMPGNPNLYAIGGRPFLLIETDTLE